MNFSLRISFSLILLILSNQAASAIDDYKLGTNSMFSPGVPPGAVTKYEWEKSKIFPGTTRDYWVYVPAQYDAVKPACVMVFQDGEGYVRTNGQWRVPIVFDNLIARKELPVMIGIFINPGVIPAAEPGKEGKKNRSLEYDSLGDAYARFLLEEILPEVSKKYNLATNAASRAICGSSSGGICSFTVAWERPNEFSKVLSTIGSFTDIRGGYVYPFWIRKQAPKPIRVFLQDGSNDLDNPYGNWPLANQTMAAALKFAKYDYQFVFGDGQHSAKHGGAIFPDAVNWLWRDYQP
ncbi:MAG: alpha/beta hydrolase-fold protein [Verrucomicrobiota bacterium]